MLLAAPTFATELAYLGTANTAGPALATSLERRLVEQIITTPQLHLLDSRITADIQRTLSGTALPLPSQTLNRRFAQSLPDSVLVVWGRVDEVGIVAARRGLFRTELRATLRLSLVLYSLSFKRYYFAGDVSSTLRRPKGWLFFASPATATHITAQERMQLSEQLIADVVPKAVRMIAAVASSEREKVIRIEGIGQAEQIEDPGLDELFNLPSVEAPLVK
jgi:hypothetical protein